MVSYDNSNVFIFQFFNNGLNIFNSNGIYSSERFIQQNKPGFYCQRAGNFHPAALAA